jgi:hypothetical protein
MSKISIESIPIPINVWVLLFLPMLLSCTTPCPSSEDLAPYNCNQCEAGFSSCIKKNFPVGSNFLELRSYMKKIGFEEVKNPIYLKKSVFSFRWSANNLANVKMIVSGRYNNKLEIIDIGGLF